QLDDPPVHARGPHRVDGRPVDHASRDRRADARVFRALLRLRRAPLEAVPQFLGGPAAGGSGHQRVAVPAPGHQRDHGSLPYTLGLLLPAILLSWWAGNKFGAIAARNRWLDNTFLPVGY